MKVNTRKQISKNHAMSFPLGVWCRTSRYQVITVVGVRRFKGADAVAQPKGKDTVKISSQY